MISAASVRDLQSEAEVIAFLRGTPVRPTVPSSFAYVATRHGVAPLVVKAGVSAWLPAREAALLVAEARRHAILAELRDRQLREALDALDAAGVTALVMKGSHLAHACYPASHLRPRDDSDVLIRPAARDNAARALVASGYVLDAAANRHALGQMGFDKPGSVAALLDLHWRIAVPIVAAGFFDFDELLGRAMPLPALGTAARALGRLDALALACVHQAAHHAGQEMLLWAYDIHLLIATFSEDDVAAFARLAASRRMARVCLTAIEPAAAWFPSRAAAAVVARLREAAASEPPAALGEPRRKIDDLRRDLAALGWRDRAGLILSHLFPPADYMRTTYARGSRAVLPWLYLRRMARGAVKWLAAR